MNTSTSLIPLAARRHSVKLFLGLVVVSLFIAGCSHSRSISNAAATDAGTYRAGHTDSPFDYRGELNEFDVLAVNRDQRVSESDIQRALDQARPVILKAGSSILVVQSGAVFPDESQQMRIRLKVALVDVRTGSWSVRCPEPFEDKSWSTRFTRGSSDQKQVEALKQKAYMACVRELTGKSLADRLPTPCGRARSGPEGRVKVAGGKPAVGAPTGSTPNQIPRPGRAA